MPNVNLIWGWTEALERGPAEAGRWFATQRLQRAVPTAWIRPTEPHAGSVSGARRLFGLAVRGPFFSSSVRWGRPGWVVRCVTTGPKAPVRRQSAHAPTWQPHNWPGRCPGSWRARRRSWRATIEVAFEERAADHSRWCLFYVLLLHLGAGDVADWNMVCMLLYPFLTRDRVWSWVAPRFRPLSRVLACAQWLRLMRID